MHLKITTTENMLAYEGDIQRISLPTEQGEKSLTETPLIKMVLGHILWVFLRGSLLLILMGLG